MNATRMTSAKTLDHNSENINVVYNDAYRPDSIPDPYKWRGKRIVQRLLILSTIPICLVAIPLEAMAGYQSRDSIRAAAQKFIINKIQTTHQSKPEVEVGKLDPRLRLTVCSEPLQAFLPPGGQSIGNTTVGVRCTGVKPWTIYVPIKVSIFRQVVMTTRPLSRGDMVTEADLRLTTQNLATLRPGYLTEVTQAIGKQLRRPTSVGTTLTNNMLVVPRMVRRGEHVTLVGQTAKVQVRVSAKALMDGASGDRIRVQNISSKQIVEGIVVSPGVVRVNL